VFVKTPEFHKQLDLDCIGGTQKGGENVGGEGTWTEDGITLNSLAHF